MDINGVDGPYIYRVGEKTVQSGQGVAVVHIRTFNLRFVETEIDCLGTDRRRYRILLCMNGPAMNCPQKENQQCQNR